MTIWNLSSYLLVTGDFANEVSTGVFSTGATASQPDQVPLSQDSASVGAKGASSESGSSTQSSVVTAGATAGIACGALVVGAMIMALACLMRSRYNGAQSIAKTGRLTEESVLRSLSNPVHYLSNPIQNHDRDGTGIPSLATTAQVIGGTTSRDAARIAVAAPMLARRQPPAKAMTLPTPSVPSDAPSAV